MYRSVVVYNSHKNILKILNNIYIYISITVNTFVCIREEQCYIIHRDLNQSRACQQELEIFVEKASSALQGHTCIEKSIHELFS